MFWENRIWMFFRVELPTVIPIGITDGNSHGVTGVVGVRGMKDRDGFAGCRETNAPAQYSPRQNLFELRVTCFGHISDATCKIAF